VLARVRANIVETKRSPGHGTAWRSGVDAALADVDRAMRDFEAPHMRVRTSTTAARR
jgi:hypothetical protein